MTRAIIEAQGLSKRFEVTHEKPALVRSIFPQWFRPTRRSACWALRDVSVSLPAGTSLAVLGSNGAGKSTLLSLLAGVLQPTSGRLVVGGSVTPVLSAGVGFHQELTGEDNFWLSACLLGMNRSAATERREEILRFAGLNGFLDAPVSSYSLGMRLRLGIAIAMHTDSEILVIDELLAVGDLAFQTQCVARLQAMRRAGKTLVFVTQQLPLMRLLSDQALLLHEGRVVESGDPEQAARAYERLSGVESIR